MKIQILVLIIFVLFSCKKETAEVEPPVIVGNIYDGFVRFNHITISGNSMINKAYIFKSATKLLMIDYIDNSDIAFATKKDFYFMTDSTTLKYKINFPKIQMGDYMLPRGEFSLDANSLTYEGLHFSIVNQKSDLGIFLNSIK